MHIADTSNIDTITLRPRVGILKMGKHIFPEIQASRHWVQDKGKNVRMSVTLVYCPRELIMTAKLWSQPVCGELIRTVQDPSHHLEGPAPWCVLAVPPQEETGACLEFLPTVLWFQEAKATVIMEGSPSLLHMTTQSIPCALKKVLPFPQDMNGRAETQVVDKPDYMLHNDSAL